MEEDVMLSLIQLAWPEHELHTAFTCGSIQGHVYLEEKMDHKIGDLLWLIPGVIRSRGAAIKTCMEPSDWKAILSVPDAIVKTLDEEVMYFSMGKIVNHWFTSSIVISSS